MKREYYSNSLSSFLASEPENILGQLLINDEFETTDLQKNAWKSEISILQVELSGFTEGEIAFEYTIPRIGHRIDESMWFASSAESYSYWNTRLVIESTRDPQKIRLWIMLWT